MCFCIYEYRFLIIYLNIDIKMKANTINTLRQSEYTSY